MAGFWQVCALCRAIIVSFLRHRRIFYFCTLCLFGAYLEKRANTIQKQKTPQSIDLQGLFLVGGTGIEPVTPAV